MPSSTPANPHAHVHSTSHPQHPRAVGKPAVQRHWQRRASGYRIVQHTGAAATTEHAPPHARIARFSAIRLPASPPAAKRPRTATSSAKQAPHLAPHSDAYRTQCWVQMMLVQARHSVTHFTVSPAVETLGRPAASSLASSCAGPQMHSLTLSGPTAPTALLTAPRPVGRTVSATSTHTSLVLLSLSFHTSTSNAPNPRQHYKTQTHTHTHTHTTNSTRMQAQKAHQLHVQQCAAMQLQHQTANFQRATDN